MATATESKTRETTRAEARPALRAEARNDQRAPQRMKPGEFLGRDGEILTRRSHHLVDEFEIPAEVKLPGWSYQWNTVTVNNQQNFSSQRDMYANGWRPVRPADLEGYFENYADGKNEIFHKGLRLEMRPAEMTEEAKLDEKRAADRQLGRHLMRADTDVRLPEGFDFDAASTRFKKGAREEVPSDLKPRYRAQVTPAGDE